MTRLDALGIPTVVVMGLIAQDTGAAPVEVAEGMFSSLPAAIGALAAAILTMVITLEKFGRLPGNKERRKVGFLPVHAAQLEKITTLLGHRVGDDARERFLLLVDRQKETNEILEDIREELRRRQ